MPPASGQRTPRSLNTSAPAADAIAPMSQSPRSQAGVGTARASAAGVKKIPTPTIAPIATAATCAAPSDRPSATPSA